MRGAGPMPCGRFVLLPALDGRNHCGLQRDRIWVGLEVLADYVRLPFLSDLLIAVLEREFLRQDQRLECPT